MLAASKSCECDRALLTRVRRSSWEKATGVKGAYRCGGCGARVRRRSSRPTAAAARLPDDVGTECTHDCKVRSKRSLVEKTMGVQMVFTCQQCMKRLKLWTDGGVDHALSEVSPGPNDAGPEVVVGAPAAGAADAGVRGLPAQAGPIVVVAEGASEPARREAR